MKPINSQEIVRPTHAVLSATLGHCSSAQITLHITLCFHIAVCWGFSWRGIGGVGAVFNALGLVCGCVNRARKFTPLARAMFLASKRAKAHTVHVWISSADGKHAKPIGY